MDYNKYDLIRGMFGFGEVLLFDEDFLEAINRVMSAPLAKIIKEYVERVESEVPRDTDDPLLQGLLTAIDRINRITMPKVREHILLETRIDARMKTFLAGLQATTDNEDWMLDKEQAQEVESILEEVIEGIKQGKWKTVTVAGSSRKKYQEEFLEHTQRLQQLVLGYYSMKLGGNVPFKFYPKLTDVVKANKDFFNYSSSIDGKARAIANLFQTKSNTFGIILNGLKYRKLLPSINDRISYKR